MSARVTLAAVIVVIGFLAGALAINLTITQAYWRPDLGEYDARVAVTETLRDSISTVFVGSSHILTGINPATFDAELGNGVSMNLSEFGALMPVQSNSLQHLKDLEMPRLRYVFFEPMLYDVPVTPDPRAAYENLLSTRNRYYYDRHTSIRAAQMRFHSDRTLDAKILGIGAIFTQYIIHLANLGVVPDILRNPQPDIDMYKKMLARRGFVILRVRPEQINAATPPDIDAGYRNISANELELLEDFTAIIKSAGAEPVFVFPPSRQTLGKQRAIRDAVRKHFPNMHVLDYSFDENPLELYTIERMWADDDHLSMFGADEFSRILAEDWQAILSARVIAQP